MHTRHVVNHLIYGWIYVTHALIEAIQMKISIQYIINHKGNAVRVYTTEQYDTDNYDEAIALALNKHNDLGHRVINIKTAEERQTMQQFRDEVVK